MRRAATLAFVSIVVVTACSDDGVPLDDSSTGSEADETGDPDTLPSTITIGESTTADGPTESGTSNADTSAATTDPTTEPTSESTSDSGTESTDATADSSSSTTEPPDESSSSTIDPTSASSESTGGVPLCGDGIAEADEVCDGDDLGAADSCLDLGYAGGVLACDDTCLHDESACNDEQAYVIDFCRLQFPASYMGSVGEVLDVFGRVYIGGLTDQTQMNDTAANVAMQVGYGPDGGDPLDDASWTWFAAAQNAGYGPGSPSFEANNDEYGGPMILPAAGEYDFAVRFTGDGGSTYTVCDGGDAGSSNGYAPADAGQLTTI